MNSINKVTIPVIAGAIVQIGSRLWFPGINEETRSAATVIIMAAITYLVPNGRPFWEVGSPSQ